MRFYMNLDLSIILAAFVIVFLAELGDKTQLVAFSLTSTSKNPVLIFIATSLALTLSTVIAALLGGVAEKILPQYTSFIAVLLFFGFGFYILFSREAPPVREYFLRTIALETSLLHLVPKVFKKAGKYDDRVTDIIRQESSHASIFRVLLREKKFFKDDINEDEQMKKLQEKLSLSRGILKRSFGQAIDEIVEKEEAVRDMYRYFCDHLSLEHHSEEKLQALLETLVEEETRHIAFFKKYREGKN
jgi:hypothetical protein